MPRWCICGGFEAIDLPLHVDVLMHKREQLRPTSTGKLINRTIPASRNILFETESPPKRESVALPGRELWILHPNGTDLPSDVSPSNIQVVLLDGTWREAARMSQTVTTWGRLVRLPMSAPSRYWLRKKQGKESYSTIEALLFLLAALRLSKEEARLRLQFELHVYAGLRSRGIMPIAERFLSTSPIRETHSQLLEQLHERRPLT
jgi:DTW domain-containing protein YfiP